MGHLGMRIQSLTYFFGFLSSVLVLKAGVDVPSILVYLST
jgi:hypothetical protein